MLYNEKKEPYLRSNADQNESYDFTIGDQALIIDILRNKLYSDPIKTLVQEYISNARDANLEAGNPPDLLEITAPSSLIPVFSVKDSGPGLSEERIKDVFVRYGMSTKRSDKKQIGGFGIGAKSAWAYSDSFYITSVNAGKKIAYLAHIASKVEGVLEVLSTCETDEPNGVEIKVPVKSGHMREFKEAIIRSVFLWPKLPKLYGINKENIPKRLFINKHFSIYSYYNETCFLNANGIPYLFEAHSPFKNTRTATFVFNVDHNRIGIVASRESYSEKKYVQERYEAAIKSANDEVDAACVNMPIKKMIETCTAKSLHLLKAFPFTVAGENVYLHDVREVRQRETFHFNINSTRKKIL